MKFMVDKVPVYMGRGVEVRIFVPQSASNSPCYVGLPTMHPISEGEMIPPALHLRTEEAQQLCDALWEAGVRPTNGEGSTGQLAATQAHLADMKTLAFHALKVGSSNTKLTGPQGPVERTVGDNK